MRMHVACFFAAFVCSASHCNENRWHTVRVRCGVTVAQEMRNTAMLQRDGISAVSSGTFESAVIGGHWSMNKLGCEDGYRSDISLVPSLGLAVCKAPQAELSRRRCVADALPFA